MPEDTVHTWYVVDLCVIGLCTDLIAMISIVFLYKSCRSWGPKECCLGKLQILSFITMILSFCYVSIDWYRIYNATYNKYTEIDNHYRGLIIANDLIYYSATILMYISLILRVDTLFKNTIYAMSRQEKLLFILLICFDVIAIGLFVFSVYCAISNKDQDFGVSDSTRLILLGITVIVNDIIINTTLIVLFFNKLYQMIRDLNQTYQILVNDIVTHSTHTHTHTHNQNQNSNTNNNDDSNNINNINNSNNNDIGGIADTAENQDNCNINDMNSGLSSNSTLMNQLNQNKDELCSKISVRKVPK